MKVERHPGSLEVQNPAKVERILGKLASGVSYNQICREEGTHWSTIRRLKDEHPERFEQWRARAASKATQVVDMALERLLEKLEADDDPERTLKTLGIVYGIASDKAMNFNDAPSQITEQRSGLDVAAARDAIEQAQKRIRAEAVTV